MRIYVRLNKKTDLWTVEARANYAGMIKTAQKSLPVTRENLGATGGAVYNAVNKKQIARITAALGEQE